MYYQPNLLQTFKPNRLHYFSQFPFISSIAHTPNFTKKFFTEDIDFSHAISVTFTPYQH